MTIHKEGLKILFILLAVLFAINYAVKYYFPEVELAHQLTLIASLIVYLLVLQFFRNPSIQIEIDDKLVLAPAEGKVVVIENTVEGEYFKDERKQISIFMSPLNVHVCRTPVGGIVKYFKYHAGKYLVAWHPKSSTENERTTMVVQNPSGTEVLVRQIAGAVARRIKWYTKENDKLVQGQEYGFIKFGSRLDVFLPLDAEIKVSLDQKTKGGKTILAELK
ncbi:MULTISPECIES: phosphatidylserine decarboxylase family protein [Reichenbachiella]|uniref:phosphatidylserine decarboxylase family protein n=1 Tax=Reichenbachiella TaxID=156993 RepID=UPI000E6C2E85|nr:MULTISPECIES: phosphatidylserine decarboxylase family protein [Reichenbachiella]MBU2914683.1 phosphatidylserine decarboxylase family protein [Reichenbachiella agariperforans]RJE71606.1 phosphatidylserine decarboxylase [Reichenbachiella sp. MSK19-1]